jgi:hypothetical protein
LKPLKAVTTSILIGVPVGAAALDEPAGPPAWPEADEDGGLPDPLLLQAARASALAATAMHHRSLVKPEVIVDPLRS